MKLTDNEQPLVSVIMPTYNQSHFIRDAIESVLNQTYRSLELIIVDNYSKDNTKQTVKSFVDNRIRYFKFANKGVIATSRNFGIKNSQGKYIAFIDSDDIWLANKLNIQIEYLEQNPDVRLVCCLLRIKSPDKRYNNKLITFKSKGQSGYMYNQLLNFNFIACSSVILKTLAVNDVGYFDEDPEIVAAEDWDLWLRIARKYRITFIAKELGIYRIHSFNLSMDGKRLQKALYVINKHLKKDWIAQKQADRARANFYFREGWSYIDKDVKLSRYLLFKGLYREKGSLKIFCVSILGIFLSIFPFLCNFIKRKSLDKKIGNRILNP